MAFWIGWLCGLGTAALHCFLWRRLLYHAKPVPAVQPTNQSTAGTQLAEEAHAWAQTRNFLRYDGTEMPVIKQYKEEIHE
ncbi:MAG: hypothetical protein II363_03730 [Clostridia bacterium]|nr:hypothetical protein [Clostridia bacterium]